MLNYLKKLVPDPDVLKICAAAILIISGVCWFVAWENQAEEQQRAEFKIHEREDFAQTVMTGTGNILIIGIGMNAGGASSEFNWRSALAGKYGWTPVGSPAYIDGGAWGSDKVVQQFTKKK